MAVCRHGPILKSKAKKKEILGSPFFASASLTSIVDWVKA